MSTDYPEGVPTADEWDGEAEFVEDCAECGGDGHHHIPLYGTPGDPEIEDCEECPECLCCDGDGWHRYEARDWLLMLEPIRAVRQEARQR